MKRVIVRKPLKLLLRLCQIVALMAIGGAAWAQEPYAPITVENIRQIVQVERFGNGVPRMMSFAPDGTWLAVGTTLGTWWIDLRRYFLSDGTVPLENVASLGAEQGGATSLAFSPDSSLIAMGGENGTIIVSPVIVLARIERLESHIYPVTALAWSPDGTRLASGDTSGVVRLWDATTWGEMSVLMVEGAIRRLSLSAQTLTAQTDGATTSWDIASGSLISQTATIADLGNPLRAREDKLNAEISGSVLRIFDGDDEITSLDGFYGELGEVFFTSDGRVGANALAPVHLWSLATGDHSLGSPTVFSPDGTRATKFGNDGIIHITDPVGREIAALHGHIRAVKAVAFSPDGRLLASASNDGTIGIWDATVSEDIGALVMLSGHNGGVTGVAFNADGTLLASSGYDGTVRLWAVATQ
jgi:WD40 repeat protein